MRRVWLALLGALLCVLPLRASYTLESGGADNITVGTTAIPTTGSLSLWVYPNATMASGSQVFLDVRDAGAANIFAIQLYSGDWYGGWVTASSDYRVACTATVPATSFWTNVVMTWDDTANETKIYKDGAQVCTTSTSLTTWSTAGETRYLGNDRFVNGFDSDFKLAYVALWNTVISGANITSLQTCDPSTVASGTQINRWPLLVDADDDVGTDHGTVNGGTLNSSDGPTLACGGGGGSTSRTGTFFGFGMGR